MKHSAQRSSLQSYAVVPKQRLNLFLISFIGLCSIWFFMFYRKTNEEIKGLQKQIMVLEKTIAIPKKNNASSQSTRSLQTEFNSMLNSVASPPQETKRERITGTAKQAIKEGLKLHACTVEKHKNKNWFKKQNVLYSMSGNTDQICRIIKKIKEKTGHFKCKTLAFKNQPGSNASFECTLQMLTIHQKRNS